MKCLRKFMNLRGSEKNMIRLQLICCTLWILLYTTTADIAEEKSKVTDILLDSSATFTQETVSSEQTLSTAATETETTVVLPDDQSSVTLTDTPPTAATSIDQTVTQASSSITDLHQEQASLSPSHVEPDQTVSTLNTQEIVTETATQSVVVEQPTDGAPAEEDKEPQQIETVASVSEEPAPEPEAYSSIQEGNQSALPEQPNGQHDTVTTEQQVKDKDEGVVKVELEKKSEDKPEELTFNEWTQKVLKAEKDKQDAHTDSSSNTVSASKQRKKKNYASTECGAKVLAYNPEATNSKSVLNSNKDDYMINPCKVKKWFVIELCEPIQTQSVDIASLELFSSQPKSFKVFLSDRYPSKDWKFAGEFETLAERIIQTFPITQSNDYFAKFVKVELVDHFGSEHFCPVTLFRVNGVAVYDEENPHDEDNDDDEPEDMGDPATDDKDTDTTNLFTSAKDTVISIVKKVLNVGPEDTDLANVTDDNGTVGVELPNLSDTGAEMLPCLPDAMTGEDGSGKPVTIAPDVNRKYVPTTPEPGKTDNVAIVTKLDDDEQVPFETLFDKEDRLKTFRKSKNACYVSRLSNTQKYHMTSKLCYFLTLAAGKCFVDFKSEKPGDNFKPEETVESSVVDESEDVLPSSSTVDITTEVEILATHSDHSEIIVTETLASSQQTTNQASSEADLQKHVSEIDKSEDVNTLAESSSTIQPTSVYQTGLPSSSIEKQSESQTGSIILDTSIASSDHDAFDSVSIEPSFSHVTSEREITATPPREETPSLTEDWKPTTGDLETGQNLGTDTESAEVTNTQKMQPQTTYVSDKSLEQAVSMDTTVTTTTTDQPTPTETETQGSTVALPDVGSPDSQKPAGDGTETKSEPKTTQDKPGDKNNATVVVQKPADVPGRARKDLDLVKVPVIPVNKRESAIMRLSNRIKVLEQNVSLSSRFLEELSKRYKKQSEDMMKMLNKTLAQLSNITVESEVKHKIHEVEMTEMENRMRNLTDVVNKLSLSLNGLNQQVKDRQMIWSSIELIFIIVLFLYVNQRRRRDELPADSRNLIDRMPSEPTSGMPHRRNSISGPATPSKKKPEFIGGSPLQRFNSETALDQDYPIIKPLLPVNQQGTDGVKKKKKKKQKLLESKAQSCVPTGVSNSDTETPAPPSSCRIGFPGLSFFTLGKPSPDTGQNTQTKSKVSQPDNKVIAGTSSTVAKPSCVTSGETGNRKGGSVEFSKKPPLVTDRGGKSGTKPGKGQDPNLCDKNGQKISPSTARKTESTGVKGHRRQRSLPKQHYAVSDYREPEGLRQIPKSNNHVENGGVTYSNGVHDVPLRTSGMKKSGSLPLSSVNKRGHVIANRKSAENIGRPVYDKTCDISPTESTSRGATDYSTDTHSKTLHKSHTFDGINGNGWHDEASHYTNGLGHHYNGINFTQNPVLNKDSQESFGKMPNRNRAKSLDEEEIKCKPGIKTTKGSMAPQGNINSNANCDSSTCSTIGFNHQFYSGLGTVGQTNLPECEILTTPDDKRPGTWKKVFDYFR